MVASLILRHICCFTRASHKRRVQVPNYCMNVYYIILVKPPTYLRRRKHSTVKYDLSLSTIYHWSLLKLQTALMRGWGVRGIKENVWVMLINKDIHPTHPVVIFVCFLLISNYVFYLVACFMVNIVVGHIFITDVEAES